MKCKKTGRLDTEFGQNRYIAYSAHYVCFICRKMFNQVNCRHWYHGAKKPPKKGYPCPDCGAEMQDAGKDFKPPRRQNINQWRKAEMLFRHGYRWAQWFEVRHITEGAWNGWSHYETVSNGPRARTLREARQDYPPRVDEKK